LIVSLLRHFGVPGVFAEITACMLVVMVAIGGFWSKSNGVQLGELSH
jgi:putative MFS transporter